MAKNLWQAVKSKRATTMASDNVQVRLFDHETGKISEIPAAELAPNMVAFELPRVGVVYMDAAASLLIGEVFPPIVSPEWEKMVETLFALLPPFFEKDFFVDGLRTDGFPVQELKVWMLVAALYHDILPSCPRGANLDVMDVLLALVNNGKQALQMVDFEYVGRDLAISILNRAQAFTLAEFTAFWKDKVDLDQLRLLSEAESRRWETSSELRRKLGDYKAEPLWVVK